MTCCHLRCFFTELNRTECRIAVRVATLDGLVKQMRSGEIDLSQSILVGSDDAIKLSKQLLADGSAVGAMP